MPRIKALLTLFLILLYTSHSSAQSDSSAYAQTVKKRAKSVNNAVLINVFYSALFPIGELGQRFGFSNNVGLNLSYKMKHNWLIGIEGAFIFGSHVRENQILSPVSTYSTGQFIQAGGGLGDVGLELSGTEVGVRVGKIFSLSKKHPNSGIILTLEPGFIQHKIWIRATTDNYPQFSKAYQTGYDRLTNGPMISGYLGYLYLERKRFLSFYGGIDFSAGFTQNRRAWNFFDSSGGIGGPDTHHRIDMMIGIKLGWVIPVFINKDNEVYF